MRKSFFLFILLLSTCNYGFSADKNHEVAKQEITNRLNKWSEDFNNKNLTGACSLFAADLIATFPGTADRNYDAICNQFKEIFADTTTTIHYDVPKIEQILIDGDLAIVRLIWTQKTTVNNQTTDTTERGLDVFKKQSNGSWKISISYAYPGKSLN